MNAPVYHIVLVEDDEAHAELVSESFRLHPQFRLTILPSLKSARELLKDHQPDLLFADLVLPDGRGNQLLPEDRETAPFPTVLITSYGDERTAVKMIKGGAFDYLTKSDQLFIDMPRIAERVLREWQELVKRRKTEQALRRSEEHLRMALEAANAGTWEWDISAGRFTHSAGVERFFNLPERGVDFSITQYMEQIEPDDQQIVQGVFEQALNETVPYRIEPYQVELRTLMVGERERWLSVQGNVIRDEQGKPLRVAGTIVDISVRKEAEAKLRSMEDHLAHVSRVSTMGEMISGIAHELNQPLYTIQNYSKASLNLMAQDTALNADQIREWLVEISETATHAGKVLMRLRDFVQKVPSKRAAVDVRDVVEKATAMLRYDSGKQNITIFDTIASGVLQVKVDTVQIEQVLVNLLRNSFEAMEQSNINGSGRVTIAAEGRGDKIEVTVADNGPGLPEGSSARVFDAFSTTKPEGMGLGLAIARTIVESHGGKLWSTPNKEEGVSFHFTLPIGEGI
jgi:two-component system sensor kinase FixL